MGVCCSSGKKSDGEKVKKAGEATNPAEKYKDNAAEERPGENEMNKRIDEQVPTKPPEAIKSGEKIVSPPKEKPKVPSVKEDLHPQVHTAPLPKPVSAALSQNIRSQQVEVETIQKLPAVGIREVGKEDRRRIEEEAGRDMEVLNVEENSMLRNMQNEDRSNKNNVSNISIHANEVNWDNDESMKEWSKNLFSTLVADGHAVPHQPGGAANLKGEEYVYKWRTTCLKHLKEGEKEFLRYVELTKEIGNVSQMGNMYNEQQANTDLLDTGFLYENRMKTKNDAILKFNSEINGREFEIWDVNKHVRPIKRAPGDLYTDEAFRFDASVLKNYKLIRIPDIPTMIVYHEETLAEGIIFSEVNITAVSSALACLIHYDNRMKTRLIKHIIFPHFNDTPVVHKPGCYQVKVFVNSCYRNVSVDDTLLELNGRIALTTTARNEVWPAILEKAILKLYDCKDLLIKTNPSIEIYHLSGWIPELIKFSDINDKLQLFTKISQNFEDGNVLLCLGINDNIFFPVIDFKVSPQKENLVKVLVASQPLKAHDVKTYSELLNPISASTVEDTGVLWVNWNNIVQKKFDTLYLSWNPSIYSNRFILDSVWYRGEKNSLFWNEEYSVEYNPQFLIHIPPHDSNMEIRIYLERFAKNNKKPETHPIGYKLFAYNTTRTFFANNYLRACTTNKKEIYSDVFIFEKSERSEYYTLAILKNNATVNGRTFENEESEVFFSIGIMSFFKIDVVEIPYNVAKQTEQIMTELKPEDFGGVDMSPTFVNNPVFIIDVFEQTSYQMKVEFSNPKIFSMICLIGVESNLEDVRLAKHDYFLKQANAGHYSEGVSELNCSLEIGRYMLIVSLNTPVPMLPSNMRLVVNGYSTVLSDHPEVVVKNPPKKIFEARRSKDFKQLDSNLKVRTSKQLQTFSKYPSQAQRKLMSTQLNEYHFNPGVHVNVKEITKMRIHIVSNRYARYYQAFAATNSPHEQPMKPPTIAVTVFKINSFNDISVVLSEQVSQTSAAWGYYSEEMMLQPNNNRGYLIVCTSDVEGIEEDIELEILSSGALDLKDNRSILSDFKHNKVLSGKWSDGQAGGGMNEKHFVRNPFSFIYCPDNDVHFFVQLSTNSNSTVGIYLIPLTKSQSLQEIRQEEIDRITASAVFSSKNNSLYANLSKGNYLLVATTLNSNHEGEFTLNLLSTKELNIREGVNQKRYQFSREFVLQPIFSQSYFEAMGSAGNAISM